jgi:biopolymer transport protein ExbB/TolQ
VLDRLHEVAEEPKHFLLFNRIQFALSNLRNMGRIGDVDEVLRSRAQNDESAVESSYTVVKGLIWAIPVLGFIGTVIGLSKAIGGFGSVLNEAGAMDQLRPALQSVTAGLATAFETTLQALIAALIIQMLMTFVKRGEERMLDDFITYCDRQIVGRLRLRDHTAAVESSDDKTIAS